MAKVNTLFNYFGKTPQKNKTPSKKDESSSAVKGQNKNKAKASASDTSLLAWKVGDLVWAKLEGYPWWPCLVCNPPQRDGKTAASNAHVRDKKIHVQFFDDPPSRSWIKDKYVKKYTGSDHKDFQRGGTFYATDPDVNKAVLEADDVIDQSRTERLELVVAMEPSDDEEDMDTLTQGIDFNNDLFDAEIDSDEENKAVDENKNPNKVSPNQDKSPRKKVTTPVSKSDKSSKSTRSSARQPKPKRRRIIESGDEELSEDEYKPEGGADVSDDDVSSGDPESEQETGSEPETPQKDSKKRKRPAPKKSASVSSSRPLEGTPSRSAPLDTRSASLGSTPVRPSTGFTPSVSNKTISKLSSFAKSETTSEPQNEDGQLFEHVTLEFLKPEKIKDADRRAFGHPEYDPRTLYVPDSYLNSCTPASRQWWEMKRKHFDTVLFFKMGKFYELFHMDATVAVEELGLIYMKGKHAHSGFPEIAYGRYADSLIQKGFKVARIEQTETPAMMDERVKGMNRPTKYDKVVKREICSIQTKGTKRYSFIDGDSSDSASNYLLAIAEREGSETGQGSTYGVCFVDTTIGKFHIGQFTDDRHCSRLRTLVSHYPPAHILYERGGLSEKTYNIVNKTLVSALKEALKSGAEFWDSSKTLKKLSEKQYFRGEKSGEEEYPPVLKQLIAEGDTLGHTATEEYELAVRALGAVMWFTGQCFMDEELFSMKNFELYVPVDSETPLDTDEDSGISDTPPSFLQGRQKMVLDGVTLANLDILENSVTGSSEGTLLQVLDQCVTPFGKRLFKQWLCAPPCNPRAINERLDAVDDLISHQDIVAEVLLVLRKLPDLERQLQKIHTLGSARRSTDHPEARAIYFEDVAYSKRKIEDFLSTLIGFKAARTAIAKFKTVANNLSSKLLRQAVSVTSAADDLTRGFPDLTEELEFFDNAFDHEKAKKEGTIKPRKGVDEDFDAALHEMDSTKSMLDDYLEKQKQRLGCRSITYWGTAKNRYQMEIPESACRNVPDEYIVTSTRKGFKRYRTKKIENMLAELITAEENKEAAIKDIMRRIFFNFDKSYLKWDAAVQCLAVLDVLICLSQYSRCGDGTMCRPVFTMPSSQQQPCIVIREGRHPCLVHTFSGGDYIPNDTVIGTKDENSENPSDARVVLVTGPNMGGKSTLMRQAGLIVIMAQLGCYVPAEECRLTPVDRVFTRLGATDRIMAGESTFFVELSETSAILQHSSAHSFVLMDELGRGTATYDGTAIACAVLARLSQIGCRTLFSTHYHSLVDHFSHDSNIRTGHMACMVENENEEDPSQETITFLYKFIEGACPKSYGFNAARLADIPEEIISVAHKKARDFQASVDKLKTFRQLCKTQSVEELNSCVETLKTSL